MRVHLPRERLRRLKRLARHGQARVAGWLRPGPGSAAATAAAVRWIAEHTGPEGAVQLSSLKQYPYPEVTGYLLPTMRQWGLREEAAAAGRWLAGLQHESGAIPGPGEDPHEYIFDTGQALRGFLDLVREDESFLAPVRQAADWLTAQMQADGRLPAPPTAAWELWGGRRVPEAIHLYVLPPLRAAAELCGRDDWAEAADRCWEFYKRAPGLLEWNTLSHFHAYILEALVDLGERELAAQGMAGPAAAQFPDGAIPAYPGVDWICSTGQAQYAVIWYKLGERDRAERAVRNLERRQRRSGGFYGSWGPGARYFPGEEISWAVKYFLDAQWWRGQAEPGATG